MVLFSTTVRFLNLIYTFTLRQSLPLEWVNILNIASEQVLPKRVSCEEIPAKKHRVKENSLTTLAGAHILLMSMRGPKNVIRWAFLQPL